MIIKIDFVSNSSSTGFIVAVPTEFIASKEDIMRYYNSHDINNGDMPQWNESEVLEEFEECINILKEGKDLWYYGDQGCDSRIFYTIIDICDDQNFRLSTFEIGGEGNNMIQSIAESDLNKWFMGTQLQKMAIEVKDEQN